MLENEAWRVQLKTGELRLMSLDALDEAFHAGVIDAQTAVLAPGALTWERLGTAAGLDEAEADPVLEVATPSLSPVAISPMSGASLPPPSPYAGSPVSDLDLELPDDALKPKRGRVVAWMSAATAVMLAVGIGLVMKVGGRAETRLSEVKVTTAVEAPPAAVSTPAPAPAEPAMKASALTDDQKKKLAGADKAREEKARLAKEKAAAQQQRRKGARTKGTGLLKGGNSFDPLNGSL